MDVLLKRLLDSHGIPGYEGEIANILNDAFSKLKVYRRERDGIGNFIARRKEEGKPSLMIAAHMDEIGLMVKSINDKGFIRFIKIGGIDDRALINQRVVLLGKKGKVYGTIGGKPPHLLKEEEKKQVMEAKDLFIDIGAKDRKDAEELGISIGTPICFDVEAREMVNGLFTGKAIDDRVGCYTMFRVAEKVRRPKFNLMFVGTMGEEVSTIGKGAMLRAYAEEPDYFVAVDTSIASDHPEASLEQNPVELNKGPVITLVEASGRGNIASMKLVEWLKRVAEKKGISYQLEVVEGGATDASHVYPVKRGIPSIALCIPARYIHSNVGIASLKDVESTVSLLTAAIEEGL